MALYQIETPIYKNNEDINLEFSAWEEFARTTQRVLEVSD